MSDLSRASQEQLLNEMHPDDARMTLSIANQTGVTAIILASAANLISGVLPNRILRLGSSAVDRALQARSSHER